MEIVKSCEQGYSESLTLCFFRLVFELGFGFIDHHSVAPNNVVFFFTSKFDPFVFYKQLVIHVFYATQPWTLIAWL